MFSTTKIPTPDELIEQAERLSPEAQVLVDLCLVKLRSEAKCLRSRPITVPVPAELSNERCVLQAVRAFEDSQWTVSVENNGCFLPCALTFAKSSARGLSSDPSH